MPKFYEIYGQDLYMLTDQAKLAHCPFINNTCDGGGNRHQTKINLSKSELKSFFSENLKSVIPGVCSIEYGNEAWIVCPRRLLGFYSESSDIPVTNDNLHAHEREALIKAGVPQGIELGVWPEVSLRYGDDDTSINYHFDFVIAPIKRDKSFSWLLNRHGIEDEKEIESLKQSALTGKYLSGKYDAFKCLKVLPDLQNPIIIEVMTASTSGSDTEARTDIASSFTDAIIKREHNCPGINKRQVWGRMATQLFAKSALAESWGGENNLAGTRPAFKEYRTYHQT